MFNSLETLCEEFGLDKKMPKTKLRSAIKKQMLSIHSDKTGGDFPNIAIKQLYLRLQEALQYLENSTNSVALQKRDMDAGAIEQRVAALEASIQSRGLLLEETAQRTSEFAAKYYRRGWLSSAVFAAICATILPFSQNLSNNFIFSSVASVLWIRILLASIFITSGTAFVIMRSKELRLKHKVSVILSEDGIAWAVRTCIYNYTDEINCKITQRKLMDAIGKCGVKWHKSKLIRWLQTQFGTKIPRDVAEIIAKAQISTLVERGVLQRRGIQGVEPLYVISDVIAKEICDDYRALIFDNDIS
jgi:hypothetical protein